MLSLEENMRTYQSLSTLVSISQHTCSAESSSWNESPVLWTSDSAVRILTCTNQSRVFHSIKLRENGAEMFQAVKKIVIGRMCFLSV